MITDNLKNSRRKNEPVETELLRAISTILSEISDTYSGVLEGTANASNVGTGVGVFDSKDDSLLQFRSLSGNSPLTVALSGSTIHFTIDQANIDHTLLSNIGTLSHEDLEVSISEKEDGFEKNTAFNKDFGSSVGTVCEGSDSRIPPAVSGSPSGSFLRDDNTWAEIEIPSPTKYETLLYELSGEVAVGCLGHYMSERTQTVSTCRVGVLTAPSGSSIYVDIRKNTAAASGSILASPVELAPTVSEVNEYYGVVETVDSEIAEGDLLYMLITDIGSSIAGSDLMMQVVLEYA